MKTDSKIWMYVLGLLVTACSKQDPAPEETLKNNPQELITTVRLEFTNQNDPNDVVTVQWQDLDGPGGNDPVIDSLKLKTGITYDLKTSFLDEVNNENITDEVKAEGVDHQVFYTIVPHANFLNVTVTDKDAADKDLGLEGIVQVLGDVGKEGTLQIILKHQPGIKDGNIDVGETDVDVEFPVSIIP